MGKPGATTLGGSQSEVKAAEYSAQSSPRAMDNWWIGASLPHMTALKGICP